MGFWARVKNLPAVSAFFSLLPISGKSGGPDISSLRDLFLLGVWLLSFVLFTSFCWKEKDFKLDGYSVYPSLGLPQ